MRKKIKSIVSVIFCIGVMLLSSCTKMDHYYKDYIIERTYVGKPDSIWIQSGEGRVQISWWPPQDPIAKDIVILWNSADSIILPIDHNVDMQSAIIDNLEERDYIFKAYTTDRAGHVSLPMEMSTEVYGANYKSTLRAMSLSHSVFFPNSITLLWNTLQPDDLAEAKIEFIDKAGTKQQINVTPTAVVSTLVNADPTAPIHLKTGYKPVANMFESIFTESTIDPVATKRNTLTFSSTGYLDAAYVDFNLVRIFNEAAVPSIVPGAHAAIDMCYALGAGSRGNLFSIDGTGFSAFAATWQTAIELWPVRNYGRMKLNRGAAAIALYDGLDETDRSKMIAAYENSSAAASVRLSSLAVNDVILLYSKDRGLYVAMKVIATPPNVSGATGDFTIEIKVSRP